MIIGTAGHIDHGKTALVRALTGVDTDRLKEEKARGMSIELGYAYKPLLDGRILGFVDVPGHERFVDHMVAGVTGIDFVLLVVAADDGPMPQTIEHLDILKFLGVREGAVALTKIDRCEPAQISQSEREIVALLAGTQLADAPIFRVSSITGEGVDALGSHLANAAAASREKRGGAGFRLAVDRSFTLDGFGTVVTGTVFAGETCVRNELRITPLGTPVRVRSIHAQNHPAERGHVGERCALVLTGVAKDEVERGDWIVAPELHAPTVRFDARLSVSTREREPLGHWRPVHLHLGAAHVMARIALLDVEQIAPGTQGIVQVVSERPIGALAGDRFILRDASGSRTIGGGYVIDPYGPARRRKALARLENLRRMEEPDQHKRLATLLEHAALGIDLKAYGLAFNLGPNDIKLDASAHRISHGHVDLAFSAAHWETLCERLIGTLSKFHGEHPKETGLNLERLRRMAFPQLTGVVVTAIAASLVKDGRITCSGNVWHLPTHDLSSSENSLAGRILPLLDAGRFDPPRLDELASKVRISEHDARNLLVRLARRGLVFQVAKDHFFARTAVSLLASIVRDIEDHAGAVRAGEFRDRIGLGRKRAIEILEFFDRAGYTQRAGEVHRVRPNPKLDLEDGVDAGEQRKAPL